MLDFLLWAKYFNSLHPSNKSELFGKISSSSQKMSEIQSPNVENCRGVSTTQFLTYSTMPL